MTVGPLAQCKKKHAMRECITLPRMARPSSLSAGVHAGTLLNAMALRSAALHAEALHNPARCTPRHCSIPDSYTHGKHTTHCPGRY